MTSRARIASRCALLPAVVLFAAAWLLASCASSPESVAVVDQAAVASYRTGAYRLPPEAPVRAVRISGPVNQAPWTVALTRPADTLSHPVIVYLPALGQAADAPNIWIAYWARAGYAVLSVQPLDDDANVWGTPEARSGDFERIARSRYTDDLMADRIARLTSLVAEIHLRSRRAESGLDGIDWSHLVVAGSDLGAFTVQQLAQARPGRLVELGWPVAPCAFIAISPYSVHEAARDTARDSAGGAAAAGTNAPVLMVSSRDDVDAYGVVTDTAVRRRAFDRLGGAGDFYFELGTASHRWLAGVPISLAGEPAARRRATPMDMDPGPKRQRGAHGSSDGMAPGGIDDDVTPDTRAAAAKNAEEAARARSRVMTTAAMSEVSFEAVTTAFLDASVRGDGAARAWLGEPAAQWLRNGDRLKHD